MGRVKNFDKSAALTLRLKVDMELARTVSADSEFQAGMTRLLKKIFPVFDLVSGIESLRGWPRENL